MEYYYITIVIVLFALAVSDLIVGVCNDAVNFLNSAIGSKAAPFKVIMAIASMGIIVGATFSSGMMEVARQSIFHPDQFFFQEIMIIFLAVMITDIILLDTFNTFALPTSTTVSIVFELLGAAVAVSIIKITRAAEEMSTLVNYINSERAFEIVLGIFISILIAFTVGAIIQFLVRMVFSFNVQNTIRYWGGVWGGISFSAITYFMLIKGAKGASFITENMAEWISSNNFNILLLSFLAGTIIFQLILVFTKFNILKIIVLLGTFALAMAFAGNDLVNFIGVPLAGFESFKAFLAEGSDPGSFTMEILKQPVKTPTLYLLLAGLIMAVTLRFSRKARSVTATEIDLGSQQEGFERFKSSSLARLIVRSAINLNEVVKRVVPTRLQERIDKRLDIKGARSSENKPQEKLAFDLVRASVNLVVASILISIGTTYKLPLSTTYVTFMVSMGSSLSDRAWGRESAVYRITGVLTVIGGWFLTAMIAFSVSFMIALIINYAGLTGIVLLIALVIFLVIKSKILHNRREMKNNSERYFSDKELTAERFIDQCSATVQTITINVSKLFYLGFLNFSNHKRKDLQNVLKDIRDLSNQVSRQKANLPRTIQKLEQDEIETGHHYVQVLDYLKETTNCLQFVVEPLFQHVDNNHPPLLEQQANDLLAFNEKMSEYFNYALTILKNNSFEHIEDLKNRRDILIEHIFELRKKQIKQLKKEGKGTKVSLLYMDVMNESRNMLLFVANVLEAYQQFVDHGNQVK